MRSTVFTGDLIVNFSIEADSLAAANHEALRVAEMFFAPLDLDQGEHVRVIARSAQLDHIYEMGFETALFIVDYVASRGWRY